MLDEADETLGEADAVATLAGTAVCDPGCAIANCRGGLGSARLHAPSDNAIAITVITPRPLTSLITFGASCRIVREPLAQVSQKLAV